VYIQYKQRGTFCISWHNYCINHR